MPRRRQRFSNLEYALKLNGGQPGTNSVLTKYVDFKTGKTKVDRRKAALTDAERQRKAMALAPFNVEYPETPDNSTRYIASITAYSFVGVNGLLGTADTALGYTKTVVAGKTAQREDAFYPALLKPFVSTAAGKSVTSKITGREYKYVEGRSYAAPFGRTTAGGKNDSEEVRRTTLTAAVQQDAAKNVQSVGYDPEVFRGLKSALPELLTT